MDKLGIREAITYQPASRYWPFQWIETGIFLALALALAGFCFWRLGPADLMCPARIKAPDLCEWLRAGSRRAKAVAKRPPEGGLDAGAGSCSAGRPGGQ